MADEIRIVAKLDTTDIVNGVRRTEQAAREMKQVWESLSHEDFLAQAQAESPQYVSAGESAGQSFMDGFLGKFLLRDAIRGVLSGIKEMFAETFKGLEGATGGGDSSIFNIWKDAAAGLRSAISLIPGIGRLEQGHEDAGLGAINANEQQRQTLDRIKADPSSLKEKSSDIAEQLEELDRQMAENKKANFLFHQHEDQGGGAQPGDLSDAAFKTANEGSTALRSFLAELLSVAKENERKNSTAAEEAGRKSAEATDKRRRDEETAMENSRAEVREDTAKKAKAAAAAEKREEEAKKLADAKAKREAAAAAHVARNRQEHANARTIAGDEEEEKGATKSLEFDRGQLEHQRATSAVRIGGGLFGRNDSAAVLVQHAATTVSLLRSINEELKQTRQNQSDLTLL